MVEKKTAPAAATVEGHDDISHQNIKRTEYKKQEISTGDLPPELCAYPLTQGKASNPKFGQVRTKAALYLLGEKKYTRADLLVAGFVLGSMSKKNRFAWPSDGAISKATGVDRRTVLRAKERLKKDEVFIIQLRFSPKAGPASKPVTHYAIHPRMHEVGYGSSSDNGVQNDAGNGQECPACVTTMSADVDRNVQTPVAAMSHRTNNNRTNDNRTNDHECDSSPTCDELFYDGHIKINQDQYDAWRKEFRHWYGEDFQRVFRSIDNWLSDDSDRKIGNAGIHRWLKREYESDENVLSSRQIDAAIRSETAAECDERQRKYVIRQEIAAPGMWGRPEDISEQFVEKTLADWRKMLSELDWRQALMGFHADTNSWREEWGPSPRDSRCLAPRELMVEYGFAPAFQRGCISLSSSELAEAKHDFQHTNVEAELVEMEPRISRLPRHKDQKAAIWAALAKIDREAAERKAVIAEKDARGPWSPNYRGDGRI